MLGCNRFKVQAVRHFIIRADGFRIVVQHDRFKSEAFQRHDAVHGAVVKLDPLADPNRAGTDDQGLFLLNVLREKRRRHLSKNEKAGLDHRFRPDSDRPGGRV